MTALPTTAFAVLGLLSLRDCRVAVELDLWPTRRSRRTGSTTSQWGSSGSWRRCAAGRRVRRAGLGHLIPARKLGSSKPSVAGTETAPAKGRMDVRAVVVKQHGGPEVLEVSDREAPHTGPGQLLVDVAAAGVNFMDIYQRQGTPPYAGDLPYVPGAEGAGTVATVGPGVADFAKGDLARQAGADHVAGYENFATVVREVTNGAGAAVVYDGVGQATFEDSLTALRPRGYMVLYGAASGPVPPLELQRLAAGGSLFITRPTLVHYIAGREELLRRAEDLFTWIGRGDLEVRVGATHPLDDAARAHDDLGARRTTGKLLLLPR